MPRQAAAHHDRAVLCPVGVLLSHSGTTAGRRALVRSRRPRTVGQHGVGRATETALASSSLAALATSVSSTPVSATSSRPSLNETAVSVRSAGLVARTSIGPVLSRGAFRRIVRVFVDAVCREQLARPLLLVGLRQEAVEQLDLVRRRRHDEELGRTLLVARDETKVSVPRGTCPPFHDRAPCWPSLASPNGGSLPSRTCLPQVRQNT